MTSYHWHRTEIELVERLAADGANPRDIAEYLPGRTRNAVIGMCWRNSISLQPQDCWSGRADKKRKDDMANAIPWSDDEMLDVLAWHDETGDVLECRKRLFEKYGHVRTVTSLRRMARKCGVEWPRRKPCKTRGYGCQDKSNSALTEADPYKPRVFDDSALANVRPANV